MLGCSFYKDGSLGVGAICWAFHVSFGCCGNAKTGFLHHNSLVVLCLQICLSVLWSIFHGEKLNFSLLLTPGSGNGLVSSFISFLTTPPPTSSFVFRRNTSL